MLPKKNLSKPRLLSVFGILLCCMLVQQSCKKSAIESTVIVVNTTQIDAFLKLPHTANKGLLDITATLRKQLLNENYIDRFEIEFGYPLWGESRILNKKDKNPITIIPLVKKGTKEITGFIYAKQGENPDYKLQVYSKNNLINVLNADPKSATQNRSDIWVLASFENSINGTDSLNLNKIGIKRAITNSNLSKNPVINSSSVDNESECYTYYFFCQTCFQFSCPLTLNLGTYCTGGSGGGDEFPVGGTPLPIGGNGGGGWPLQANANGFLYSRITELQNILLLNTYALTPCDKLNIMPLENYGPMYQRVAQFTPSIDVVNRLNSIRVAQGGWIVDNFNFQSLTDAYGTLVNCDYFPIQISQLPINNATGLQMSPAEFLEYFRLNINSFITPPVAVNFSCFFGPQFDDCTKWNQPSGNSLGALNHIYIPGPSAGPIGTSNSGSVMISDYQHINNTTNSEQHYFKFSTLETPFDYEHPVAGNREFGIFSNSNTPGQYTFYTMGVDRIWDWITEFGNISNYGFIKADELWTNIQQNMITYISNNGGVATNYAQPKIVARPKWNDVKEFLLGHIDIAELKRRLGC